MFKPHPEADARKRSAITLIKYLLAEKDAEVLAGHKRELLTILLWKITLAECYNKYKTRFQSETAVKCDRTTTKLRHDHVFPRKKMIDHLMKAGPNEVDGILERVVGCTVTKEENDGLTKFDKKHDGWQRYQNSGIKVIDTTTMTERGC